MAGYVGRELHQRPSDILELKGSMIKRLLVDNQILMNMQEESNLGGEGSESSLKTEILAKRRQWKLEARKKYGKR